MKHSGGVLRDAKRLAHFDHKATHKAGVSIVNDYLGESHALKHMFQIEFGDSFCCYRFVARNEDNRFGTIVVRDMSIESQPFDRGNLTMKSIATVSNGNASGLVNIGYSGALLVWLFTLLHWQSAHPLT